MELPHEVYPVAAMNNRRSDDALIIKIKAVGWLVDTKLGETNVPINQLLEGVTAEGKPTQVVSFPVIGKGSKGDVSFSYEIGGKFSKKAKELTSFSSQPWAKSAGQETTKKAMSSHQLLETKSKSNGVRISRNTECNGELLWRRMWQRLR